jgi:hypothetical protein
MTAAAFDANLLASAFSEPREPRTSVTSGPRNEELRTPVFDLGRDREFADSPLEEDGFKLAVPPRTERPREGARRSSRSRT